MEVVSLGPLPAASLVWQPRPGAWVLTVVARATFHLRPGEASLAPSQESPAAEDRHWTDDPGRSLRQPRDLVPAKPLAEVMLVGSAYAPEHRPTRAVVARLVVGDIDKSVEVAADRSIGPDGSVHEGLPFTQLPLTYERAAGGPGTSNPVGVPRGSRNAEGRFLVPSLSRPGAPVNAYEPIGFGPIAPSWPERRDRLGAAAGTWSFRDLATRPLPEGMDLGYFNAAPRDQQMRALGASDQIILENLHAEHARLVTRLPGIAARATLEGRRSGPVAIAMRADTLWLDTDRAIGTLTFRGMVPLERADEQGRVTVVMERAAVTESSGIMRASATESSGIMRAPEMPALDVARAPRRYEMTADIPLSARQAPAAALPFAPSVQAMREAAAPRQPDPLAAPRPPAVESPWSANSARAEAPAPPASVPVEAPTARPALEAAPAPRAEILEALELVWFDAECARRLRRKPAWRTILEAAEKAPVDPDFDDPALAKDPMLVEDRREVFEILARGEPLSPAALGEALVRCQRDDGRFVPTVALFTGELELPFDEITALRVTIGTVTPLIGADEALRGTVDTAKELLALSDLMVAPAVADGLTRRIDQAFSQGKRAVPGDYLETQRERALVEQRRYQRRLVFGERHLRALLRFDASEATPLRPTGSKAPASTQAVIPAYLPESVAGLLPLQARFRARFAAEVRLAADPAEGHAAALRVLALARAVPPFKR